MNIEVLEMINNIISEEIEITRKLKSKFNDTLYMMGYLDGSIDGLESAQKAVNRVFESEVEKMAKYFESEERS